MTGTQRKISRRVAEVAALTLLGGLILAACGTSSKHPTPVRAPRLAPDNQIVVQVGVTPITRAVYNHWMAIGFATVEMPKPDGPLPAPIVYEPPRFTDCVAHLRTSAPTSATAAQLTSKCDKTYRGIQARILNFLISGYWLRAEAAERHADITEAEVRKTFERERRAHYPLAAAFRRLQEASRQTVADLHFAVETQMLSGKLLEKFTRAHGHDLSEQAMIAAFNESIKSKWVPRTTCSTGYVIADCKQYKP
jgi:hypothetical protein